MLDRICEGRTDLVFEFVSAGNPAQSTDAAGVSLVNWCAYYGDVSAIRYLLEKGETFASLGENLGLHAAAFHGHWRLCQFLVENGADANRPLTATGETALHAALSTANRPAHHLVVRVLLAAGADPNAPTLVGADTDSFMRDCRTRGETPLHRAAAFADEATIQLLIDAGATVAKRDAFGDSPLTWASWHLRPDAILRMLCYGPFSIHPDRQSTFDHGTGWRALDRYLLGKPRA